MAEDGFSAPEDPIPIIVTVLFATIFGLMAVVGEIDARCIRKNDIYQVNIFFCS